MVPTTVVPQTPIVSAMHDCFTICLCGTGRESSSCNTCKQHRWFCCFGIVDKTHFFTEYISRTVFATQLPHMFVDGRRRFLFAFFVFFCRVRRPAFFFRIFSFSIWAKIMFILSSLVSCSKDFFLSLGGEMVTLRSTLRQRSYTCS